MKNIKRLSKFIIANKLYVAMKQVVIELLFHTQLDSAAEIAEVIPIIRVAFTVGVELLLRDDHINAYSPLLTAFSSVIDSKSITLHLVAPPRS